MSDNQTRFELSARDPKAEGFPPVMKAGEFSGAFCAHASEKSVDLILKQALNQGVATGPAGQA